MIFFNVHDVFFNSYHIVRDYFHKKYLHNIYEANYQNIQIPGISQEQIYKDLSEIYRTYEFPPIKTSFNVINFLFGLIQRPDVVFLISGDSKDADATHTRIAKYVKTNKHLIRVCGTEGKNRIQFLLDNFEECYNHFLIDDRMPTCEEFAYIGGTAFCFIRPWNIHYSPLIGIQRINSLHELPIGILRS